ncbi:hypothetical protein JD844_015047, partial [Phrynosoma platyrhinos]
PATSVLYECNKTSIHLVVQMDPWGAGLSLDPQYLHLGSCSPSFENHHQRLFHFECSLKECGFARLAHLGLTNKKEADEIQQRSHLRCGKYKVASAGYIRASVTRQMVEYSTHLVYRPPSSRSGLYDGPFTERINCTSYEAQPSVPAQVASVTGQLLASSGLIVTGTFMKEDFAAPSDSAVFLLGSQIHIEFAVQNFFHQPLQIFVDECIAATSPKLSKSLRNYTIIANHGCVVDGKVANSQFLPRRAPEALRLSLQAFEFLGLHTDIYLHCRVSAWDPKVLTEPTRKACSFRRDVSRWEPLDDPTSSVCSCCDSVCQVAGFRRKRDLRGPLMDAGPLQSNAVVGRLTIQKSTRSAGSYEWDANSFFALQRHHKGGEQDVMPPVVGVLLLEVTVMAMLSLGYCFYNG